MGRRIETAPLPRIAALYSRVSSKPQDDEDKTSLATQEAGERAWAQANGWLVDARFTYRERHTGEELWERLGRVPSVAHQPWPSFDPALVVSDRMTIPIQVNGKLRGKIELAVTASREQIEALAREQVQEWVQGKPPRKVIYVEKKLINFVV